MALTIRDATMADHPALSAIFAEVQGLHATALPRIFSPPTGPALSEEYVAEILADADAALFVAEQGAEVIGMLIIRLHEVSDNGVLVPRRYAMIHDLGVKHEYQRAGAGRALIERAQAWAHERGATDVELIVWAFNAQAIAFYERLGYTTHSRKMVLAP